MFYGNAIFSLDAERESTREPDENGIFVEFAIAGKPYKFEFGNRNLHCFSLI